MTEPKQSFWRLVFSKNVLKCMILGFSSGLPLFVLINLLPIWLRNNGIDLTTIGLFSLLMFPYNWKFLWAPLCDAVFLRKVGRRRTWMLATQVLLLAVIIVMAKTEPGEEIKLISILAVLVAILSATQDIVVDAYRREILSDRELGFGTSIHVNFYRLSALVPGSLALIISDSFGWSTAFTITGLFMLPGVVLSLFITEPKIYHTVNTFKEAVVEPFREFFVRKGGKGILVFFLFLFFYKLGDSMATALVTPFYTDMSFSPTEIGVTAKVIGSASAIVGAIVGGLIMIRIGINRALWYFGVVQLITILGFAWLSIEGHNLTVLSIAVAGEYLGVGLGTAAFTAFISRETNPAFTATQFALFTSIAALPRVVCNSFTGYLADVLGWTNFFYICTALAIPGMLMLIYVAPYGDQSDKNYMENK